MWRGKGPTCGLDVRVGDAQARMASAGWDVCVVVDDAGCILGRLRQGDDADPDALVEIMMESGSSTQRPDVRLGPLSERMRGRRVEHVLVSTSAGQLVGVLYRADMERLDEASRRLAWDECDGCPGTWRLQGDSK